MDKAAECYRRALQLAPDYLEAHLNLGGVLIAQGKLNEAADCYRQVMRIDPGNSIAAHMLAALPGPGGGPEGMRRWVLEGYRDAGVPADVAERYDRNTYWPMQPAGITRWLGRAAE